jgi:hypothetical protein
VDLSASRACWDQASVASSDSSAQFSGTRRKIRSPVSPEGKALAVVLMFMAVALFGAIAATLVTVFIKSDARKNDPLLEHMARLEAKIDLLVEGHATERLEHLADVIAPLRADLPEQATVSP